MEYAAQTHNANTLLTRAVLPYHLTYVKRKDSALVNLLTKLGRPGPDMARALTHFQTTSMICVQTEYHQLPMASKTYLRLDPVYTK
jgi:hypothetical protein